MISHERLVAPHEHLGILIEPAAEQIHAVLANQPDPTFTRVLILDRPLSEWRAELRQRLGLTSPTVVTGHQAEFFHAGVFAKLVATHVLANQNDGTALFLTVDSDPPKTRVLAVPEITARGLRRVDVPIPGGDPQCPDECQPQVSREKWLDFFVRVASIYEHYEASLLRPFADAWLDCADQQVNYCDAMARGRAALEGALGLPGIREIRISDLCDTPEFRAFAAHLLLNAARLAGDYNAAQAGYRQRHRVRSISRPVPLLASSTTRTELPLWIYQSDGPRRRLYVSHHGDRLELFADQQRFAELSRTLLADPDAHGKPWDFEHAGWRLRPRALTLTAFVRLFLADLFIHGIGGAKYGEVTDDCLTRFLELGSPAHCCVTATLHLPLPRTGFRREDLLSARRQSRDIRFNPQRYLQNIPAELLNRRTELIRQSDELRAYHRKDRQARRRVWEEIRGINEHLLSHDPWRAADFDQRVQALEHQHRLDQIALDREYFVALHLRHTLEELVSRLHECLDIG